MATKPEILDGAVVVLRRGDALTLDAVAREVGLTKPGVVHHFPTKEALMMSVVNHIVDMWERDLRDRTPDNASPVDRLRAYVERALMEDFDKSDLSLVADLRLRDKLCEQWAQRLNPWFGMDIDADAGSRASLRAARLLADGAWFNTGLGITTMKEDERPVVRTIALQLINLGANE